MTHSNHTYKISVDSFWRFSCDLYSKNELYIKDQQNYSLLELQNKFNKNVNICLLMLYLDELNVSIDQAVLKQLISSILDFESSYLLPLRTLRLKLKQQEADISLYTKMRKTLLDAELLMEKHQQSQLVNALNSCELVSPTNTNNLYLYLHYD